MYTEVKELVNFLAVYLVGRLPRRPASLFICQLANFLVARYREHSWDLNDPTKDEQYRIVRSKVNGFTDPLIISAATQMGLCVKEVLRYLPDKVLLFANPGEVFYRAGENAIAVPIWNGEKGVDPDFMYCALPAIATNPDAMAPRTSNMGAAGRIFYVGLPERDPDCDVEDPYVPLELESIHQSFAEGNELVPQWSMMRFTYTPKHHVSFTIREFATTRFGSHRQRPDYEAMKRIQRDAAAAREMQLAAANVDNTYPPGLPLPEGVATRGMTAANISRPKMPQPVPIRTVMSSLRTLSSITLDERDALLDVVRSIPVANNRQGGSTTTARSQAQTSGLGRSHAYYEKDDLIQMEVNSMQTWPIQVRPLCLSCREVLSIRRVPSDVLNEDNSIDNPV